MHCKALSIILSVLVCVCVWGGGGAGEEEAGGGGQQKPQLFY